MPLEKIDEVPKFEHGLSDYFLSQLKSEGDREAVKTYFALKRSLEWSNRATIMLNNSMVDFQSSQSEMAEKIRGWEDKMNHPLEVVAYFLKKPIMIIGFIMGSAVTAYLGPNPNGAGVAQG